MKFIMISIENDFLIYQEPMETEVIDEKEKLEAIILSEKKIAGKVDHPLSMKFILELLKR